MTTATNTRRIGAEPVRTASSLPERPRDDWTADQWRQYVVRLQFAHNEELGKLKREVETMQNAIIESQRVERIDAAQERSVAVYGQSALVKDMGARLQAMLPNAADLGAAGCTLLAQIAIAHGLDPLPGADQVYAWKQGQKVIVTIGYKGLLHLARRQLKFNYHSRPMTPEEREEHQVPDAGYGYVTELHELRAALECKEAGIPYYPIVGTAVWKPGDQVAASRSAAWQCKKNSLKDALRQVTTTGSRMSQMLDAMFGQAAEQTGAQIENTWESESRAFVLPPEGEQDVTDEQIQDLVDAGYIQPDQDEDEIPDAEYEEAPGSDAISHSITPDEIRATVRQHCIDHPGTVYKQVEQQAAKKLGVPSLMRWSGPLATLQAALEE